MNYSSLTPTQREHVAFLFADDLFGTDPNGYEYELMGETVTGRARVTSDQSSVHVRKAHAVAVNVAVREVPGQYVTVECGRDATIAIQEIARNIIARLISQPVEA